jgi:hypothetical protein
MLDRGLGGAHELYRVRGEITKAAGQRTRRPRHADGTRAVEPPDPSGRWNRDEAPETFPSAL